MRWLAALLLFCAATYAGLWVAAHTKVGPVLFVVSQHSRHGVHLGDIAAFVIAYTWAAMLTLVMLFPQRR
jgi:hypothetical protein